MTKIDNSAARVYSEDKKLWLGMTREEAYRAGAKILKSFNYADKDGNQQISQKELTRYNAPVVIENYEEVGNSRVVTQGIIKNNSIFVGSSSVSLTSELITNKEEEFYAGLRIKEVSAKGSEKFYAMDTNHDGVLSKSEMKTAAEVKRRASKSLADFKNTLNVISKCMNKSPSYGAGIGGVGLGATLLLTAGEDAALGSVIGGLAGTIVGLVIGLIVGSSMYLYANHKYNNEKAYEKLFNEAMGDMKSNPYAKMIKADFIKKAKILFKGE